MAPKATVLKAELQVSDMDRHVYGTFPLTVAQHPSETEQRVMVRILAFALHADERLEFGRGLSNEEEADLWWERAAPTLQRLKNLSVIDLPAEGVDQLTALYQRGMRLNCMLQDGEVHVMGDANEVVLRPEYRLRMKPGG